MTPRQFVGRLLYGGYHAPAGAIQHFFSGGGPFERHRTERGRAAMEAAAFQLPRLDTTSSSPPLAVHLLTGRRFWYQTAFCLYTLSNHAARPVAPIIYDDGSLEPNQRAALVRIFPLTQFVTQQDAIAKLDTLLPRTRFPFLRERWDNYPNLRKLTDPHLGSTGWKLVLDSDLLFFRKPDLLLSWLDSPNQPLHAVDCETSYGYSRPLLNELAGTPVSALVNVGLCGLRSETLDWTQLESWCRILITRERTNYYLEQALVAMLLAGRECTIATANDYVTLPVKPEVTACKAVMHHYVAESKRWYFQFNWRRCLPAACS